MQLITCHDGKLQKSGTEALGASAKRAFTTGLAAWDALAPGKAFARGAIHELLSEPRHGTPLFLAALLAAAAGREDASAHSMGAHAIIWSDPGRDIYPPALAAHGIPLDRLLLLRTRTDPEQLWSLAECLKCKGVAAVVAAPTRLSRLMARRLQLGAEQGGGVGLLLRCATGPNASCYAAATRWLVRPAPGERTIQRWNVQLIHGHGGRVGETVILEACREDHSVRAFEFLADRPAQTRPGRNTPAVARAS